MEWQKIEKAPKGGGAEIVTDPNWVEPPKLLLWVPDSGAVVAAWDWFYAENGTGNQGDHSAWVEPCSGEPLAWIGNEPTHWMPLPAPPVNSEEDA